MSRAFSLVAVVLVLAIDPLSSQTAAPNDWFQWRGPNRDGISQETGLLQEWPKAGPPQVWRITGVGNGYSSFSSSGGRLYTLGARAGIEYVVALDRATGRKVWETQNGRRFENDRGDGPRSTPTVDGDRLYVLGGSGDLTALELATGKKIWSINVVQKFGGVNPYWGYSESPLIVGDRILVNAGGRRAGIVAVAKADGSTLWQQHNDGAGYSSPMLMRTGSLNQVIYFTESRTMAVDPRDGRLLWSHNKAANGTANVATPIVRGTRVFVSSDYGTGAALLDVRAAGNIATANEVYFTREMRNHHSSSVLVADHLYGFSSSILTALRFDTGAMAWRDRSVGKGSLAFADNRLYIYSENGVVGLADASPDAYRERGRFTLSQQSGSPTWSHPIITGGLLVIRDQDSVYAYNVRGK
ncbi:MAG TPA: PQQ-binding-like beta-propeller repeat protein [Vicinamibacterales bacterium]